MFPRMTHKHIWQIGVKVPTTGKDEIEDSFIESMKIKLVSLINIFAIQVKQ